jgi:RNA polymerase sigma factor
MIILPQMEELVLKAKHDTQAMESLLRRMEHFILHSVFRVTHRFASIHDDEYSIALEAFVEAVHSFDPSKGSFLSFAYLVIRRRLIDYLKSSRYRSQEISVDPALFTGEIVDNQETESIIQRIPTPTTTEDHSLQWEILSLKDTLIAAGIHYSDLADCSPKAHKTKKSCAQAIVFILRHPDILQSVQKQKTLPLKILEKDLQIPRKTLEIHRKYIIAAVEIMAGDYPLLSEYLGFVKEEMAR